MSLTANKLPWTLYRPIGNSLPARLTVLIPIIGYLIVFNATLAQYASLITELNGSSHIPSALSVHPRLFLIYFGLCFVAAGSAIYSISCPPIIKRYSSSAEYAGGDGDHTGQYLRRLMLEEIDKSAYSSELRAYQTRLSNKISKEFSQEQAARELKNAILHTFYLIQNMEHPIRRILVAIFYAIGFGILLIPTTQIFLKVTGILFDLISSSGPGVFWR